MAADHCGRLDPLQAILTALTFILAEDAIHAEEHEREERPHGAAKKDRGQWRVTPVQSRRIADYSSNRA